MFLRNNDEKVTVVAEIGMTHDGSIGLAKKLTEAAIESGADVVKYQWHIAGEETVRNAPSPPYFTGESRYDYFARTEFTELQFSELALLCKKNNVIPCVSVFSNESVKRAVKVGFEIIKIPSGEVTNIPMLRIVAETGLPVILSSGMSNWDELSKAVDVFKRVGTPLCIMQCSSMYPTPPESVGLNILSEIKERFDTCVGLSDHTLTGATAVAAVTMGAKVIEKHFTISKNLYGPDARFSLDPNEFHQLVNDVNFVAKAMTSIINKDDLSAYGEMKNVFQKSIVASKKIVAGDILTMENVAFKKPGSGIPASEIDQILGKVYEKEADLDMMIERDFLASS